MRQDREERQKVLWAESRTKLRGILGRATTGAGIRLGNGDRLKAALFLGRSWQEGRRNGVILSRSDFEGQVLDRLVKPHGKREEFRLMRWTLPKSVTEITPDVEKQYKGKHEPQKSLEPYLAAVAVLAELEQNDPEAKQIELLNGLSIWHARPARATEDQEETDIPAENLSLLLNVMCRHLARRNKLEGLFRRIRSVNCRWEMFDERLVSTNTVCMQRIASPVFPVFEDLLHFEEMFPFPSIPLLRVPYLVVTHPFTIVPEGQIGSGKIDIDESELMVREEVCFGEPGVDGDHAETSERHVGRLTYYREIRLAIASISPREMGAVLESRPVARVTFPDESPIGGSYYIHAGFEPDLKRPLFYPLSDRGAEIWPSIVIDGRKCRIALAEGPYELHTRIPGVVDAFDPDPLRSDRISEAWYLSYTAAKPEYLRYWLGTEQRSLGGERAEEIWGSYELETCPTDAPLVGVEHMFGRIGDLYPKDLPNRRELNFPTGLPATAIEQCLHNGFLEEALQTKIDCLRSEIEAVERVWIGARETHTQTLLDRWRQGSGEH